MKNEKELRQLFKNRFDCYADTGDVVMAMTEDRFIEILSEALNLATVSKRASGEISSLTAMLNIIESGDLDSERLIMLKDHVVGRLLYLANNA